MTCLGQAWSLSSYKQWISFFIKFFFFCTNLLKAISRMKGTRHSAERRPFNCTTYRTLGFTPHSELNLGWIPFYCRVLKFYIFFNVRYKMDHQCHRKKNNISTKFVFDCHFILIIYRMPQNGPWVLSYCSQMEQPDTIRC